jgi:hypothetical protein
MNPLKELICLFGKTHIDSHKWTFCVVFLPLTEKSIVVALVLPISDFF